MNIRKYFQRLCLATILVFFVSSLNGGITDIDDVSGSYPLQTTLTISVDLEGPINGGDKLELILDGNDFYGNSIDSVISSATLPGLAGPVADTAPETATIGLSWTIPNDGTLHNVGAGYTLKTQIVDNGGNLVEDGPNAGVINIEVEVNLEAEFASYEAGTYEAGDIIEITYTIDNTIGPDASLQVRPLKSNDADEYRAGVVLTADPIFNFDEDFRLGEQDFFGDLGSFLPGGISQIRRTSTDDTPELIDSLGRNYQPQPDDGFLDIGEEVIITEQFLIPSNFSGTYFVAFGVDVNEKFEEQSELDNQYISDSTPRVRIISGPASDTLPVSEASDSVGNQVASANGYSDEPSISEDGQKIAFQSFATNLTPDEGISYNGLNQIFVRDVFDNSVALVSRSSSGEVGNGTSINSAISGDGRYVAFESSSSNLVNGDTNSFADIFVRDIELQSTLRITVNANGVQANGASFNPTISADGRFIAFESVASNLDLNSSVQPGPGTGRIQIYVADRDVNDSGTFDLPGNTAVYLVSFNNSGALADRNVLTPVLSLNADFIAFVTDAANLPSSNGFDQVYLRPLLNGQPTGSVELVSVSAIDGSVGANHSTEPALNGGAAEPNGLQVAFTSEASNLVANDTNGVSDIFVRDYSNPSVPVTRRVSISNERKAFTTVQFFDPNEMAGIPPLNNPLPGDFIILNDGVNPPTTFTFSGNVALGANAAISRDNLVAAINAQPNLLITAVAANPPESPFPLSPLDNRYGYTPGLSLINEVPGEQGNQPITEFSDVIFVSSGAMVGGGTQADNFLTPSVEQGSPTGSLQPSIDRSGALIAYRSLSQNLSINPLNGEWIRPLFNGFSNVFLYDRDVDNGGVFDVDGNTDNSKISLNRFGYPTTGIFNIQSSGSSRLPTISADGGSIAFASDGDNNGSLRFGQTNVIPLDSNDLRDIFVYIRDINRNSTIDPGLEPTVTISTPSQGDNVELNEPIILEALVTPINPSNPLSVEFFVNGISIGSDDSSPFVISWTPESLGDFTIVARATEVGVGSGVSDPVNVSSIVPSGAFVRITLPSDGSGFELGSPVNVIVEAGVANTTGTISQVEIFEDGVSIAVLTQAPYSATFTPASSGEVEISATATAVRSGVGFDSSRDSVTITVALNPPNVSIVTPLDGDVLPLNQTTIITASAQATASNIRQVEFLVNGESVGIDTSFPYSAPFTPTVEGDYIIQALAENTEGVIISDNIRVSVENTTSTIRLLEPLPATQFSILLPLPVTAEVNSTKPVRLVEFFANGEAFATDDFAPYQASFQASAPNDFIFSAQVTFTDGTKVSSPAVPTEGLSTPLATSANFINQVFLDFTGTQPPESTFNQLIAELDQGEITQADAILRVLNTIKGSSGTSIIGAYQTLLQRYPDPIEYQSALLDVDTTSPDEVQSGFIDIALGDTVTGQLDGNLFDDIDTYRFDVPGAQVVTAFIVSPIFINLTLRNSDGTVIDSSSNGFFSINPTLTNSVTAAGTYLLDVDGIGTGTYTLTLSGEGGSSTGASGSFVLTTLLNSLFDSEEYLFKFGPLPNVDELGTAGVVNRRNTFQQLYFNKYGGLPSDLQEQQGQLRINALGGVTPFTEVFINERPLDNGLPLIMDAAEMRPFWTSVLLIVALFNEQPTADTINEFAGLSLTEQINVMLKDPRYTSRFPPANSILFGGQAQPDGWLYSSWMNTWINQSFAPWYLHNDLGWLYTEAATSDSVWSYSTSLGDWIWTSDTSYPWVYLVNQQGGGWFYVFKEPGSNLVWFLSDTLNSFSIAL